MLLYTVEPRHIGIADIMQFDHEVAGTAKCQKISIEYKKLSEKGFEIIDVYGIGYVFVHQFKENHQVLSTYEDFILALSLKLDRPCVKIGLTLVQVVKPHDELDPQSHCEEFFKRLNPFQGITS